MASKLLICFVALSIGVLFASADPGCPDSDTHEAVYLPDPNDCGAFYECSNSVAHHIACPPGLYYNDELHVCTFIKDADCGGRPTTTPPPPTSPPPPPPPPPTEDPQ